MKNKYLQEIWTNSLDFRDFFYGKIFEEYLPNKQLNILEVWVWQWRIALSLKRFWYDKITVTDISDDYKVIFDKTNIRFITNNIQSEKIPIDNWSIDVIIFSHVIEHINNTEFAMNEFHRVLKKWWILIIETPDYKRSIFKFWDDYTHIRPYTKKSLQRIAKAYDFETLLIKNSKINDVLLSMFQNIISIIWSIKMRKIRNQKSEINITPLSIPKSINILYKYFPCFFFWGTDMIWIFFKS